MDLYTLIVNIYPELTNEDFCNGTISLRDDGDGVQYIAKWEYDQPLPANMKVGKN